MTQVTLFLSEGERIEAHHHAVLHGRADVYQCVTGWFDGTYVSIHCDDPARARELAAALIIAAERTTEARRAFRQPVGLHIEAQG